MAAALFTGLRGNGSCFVYRFTGVKAAALFTGLAG